MLGARSDLDREDRGTIDELKDKYTIAIVTHNMQQAARVSDYTAFMYIGELIEFGVTAQVFTSPPRSGRRTTLLAGSADAAGSEE